MGDCIGRLSILALCQDDPQAIFSGTTTHESSAKGSSSGGQILRPSAPITSIVLDQVGKCTIPATVTYFPHAAGHLFIGSQYGDSEFVQLLPEPDLESGSYIKLLDTMGNIGPVLDMIVLSQDKQSQKQIVTCSGAYGKGSLRVISSGIGLTEQAELEVEGARWLGLAARQGEAAAQCWLGACCADGRGVPVDKAMAQFLAFCEPCFVADEWGTIPSPTDCSG